MAQKQIYLRFCLRGASGARPKCDPFARESRLAATRKPKCGRRSGMPCLMQESFHFGLDIEPERAFRTGEMQLHRFELPSVQAARFERQPCAAFLSGEQRTVVELQRRAAARTLRTREYQGFVAVVAEPERARGHLARAKPPEAEGIRTAAAQHGVRECEAGTGDGECGGRMAARSRAQEDRRGRCEDGAARRKAAVTHSWCRAVRGRSSRCVLRP